jgi:hypothetical protein
MRQQSSIVDTKRRARPPKNERRSPPNPNPAQLRGFFFAARSTRRRAAFLRYGKGASGLLERRLDDGASSPIIIHVFDVHTKYWRWGPNRVVIIEFPDIASIKNWYRAPEYQPLITLRRSAATAVMIMLEGL